ncbi:MAG: HlyD family efflux transporter periplasmic adaptor subunit, partial [bacterium]
DYPQVAKEALAEMVRQTGAPKYRDGGEEGELLASGTVVRHLVLPGCFEDSLAIIDYLGAEYGSQIALSLMSQYMPLADSGEFPEIARRIDPNGYAALVARAEAMDFEEEQYEVAGYSGLIRSDAEYTVSELKEARDAEEENLKTLELDLKETMIRVERAQRAVDEGVVRAKFSGVIRSLDETGESGTVLTLVPSSGLYIETKIPEDMLDQVSEGTTVYVDGFEGRVREISLFAAPQDEYYWGGSDRPLVNYYPVTVEVSDKEANFQSGDYVSVSFSRANTGEDMGTMTLMKGFVREDNGGSYVFARGEKDRLVKRYVTVKSTEPYSYEIVDGLVDNDWIAFAYGRDTKEGAPTIEGTAQDLYA